MSETTDSTSATTARSDKKSPRKSTTRPTQESQILGRIRDIESDLFVLTTQLQETKHTSEVNAAGLETFEEVLAAQTDAVASALGQAAQRLDWRQDPFTSSVQQVVAPTRKQLRTWVATAIAPRVRATQPTKNNRQVRWCRRWWLHWEAEERLTALYLVYHGLSVSGDPGWRSVYLRDHLDHHLVELTHPMGPLHACTPGQHHDTEPLGQLDDTAGEIR